MGSSGSNLGKRIAVAAVAIPIVVGLAYAGGLFLAVFLAVFGAVAAWEFCSMNEVRGVASFPRLAVVLAFTFPILAATVGQERFVLWATAIGLTLATLAVLRTPPDTKPALAISLTTFAAIYTGGLLSFAMWLRDLDGSPGWRGAAILFLPIAVTWLGDTSAYSVGRALGRRKLAPVISPNKTWEGAIGGFAATVGGAYVWVELTRGWVGWSLPLVHILALGALISVAGQLGDLVESKLKRDCGVKDSSGLIPGHGGFLDRVDSLLYAFPVTFIYLSMVGV